MSLTLKHADNEISEYPANTGYPYLTTQKKILNIPGAQSVYTESIFWISRTCFKKNSSHMEEIFY